MGRKPTTKIGSKTDELLHHDLPDFEEHRDGDNDSIYLTIGFRTRKTDPIIERLKTYAKHHGQTKAFMVRRMVMWALDRWDTERKLK